MMSTISLLLTILLASFPSTRAGAPKLNWAAATVGACPCKTLSATSAMLTVPATYNPPEGEVKIFVKRYMTKGGAKTHLIMLPGGPGQSETILERHLQAIADYVGGSVAIYAVDMRGVGQSQAVVPMGDLTWTTRIESIAQSAPFPLGTITLSNAARDVLRLAEAIKASPEFTSGSRLSLFGVSFGATWAYRTIQLDDTVFDAALFDGILAFNGLFNPDNDESLLENCDRHPYCKLQFGGDAKTIHTMIKEILNPTMNSCTGTLDNVISKMKNQSLSKEYRFAELLMPWVEGAKNIGKRYHSSQIAMAFIKATHLCHNPTAYKEIITEIASLGSHSGAMARAADASKMNMLVNNLLFAGEPYNLASGLDPSCNGRPTLTYTCMSQFVYKVNYEQSFKKYTAPRDPIWTKKPGGKTKLYFVHGKLDLVSPYKAATQLAASVGGRVFSYDNLGHSLISEGSCARSIFREFLLGKAPSAANTCLKTTNSAPLDWTFRNVSKYAKWFDPSIDVKANFIPGPPDSPDSGGSSITWIIVIVTVMVITIGSGAIYYWRMRSLGKKS